VKTTAEYLDAYKAKLGLPSDYALAKSLGVTRAAASKWKLGHAVPDELACARIADALGIEPIEVIAAAQFERAKDEHSRAVWESIWGKAAGAIVKASIVGAVCLSVVPTSKAAECGSANAGEAGHSARIRVMSTYRRRRQQNASYGFPLAA
jgi:transcriptional regulator with XRE-family HTH domain